ncbi:MAG: hypothetical protein V1809_12665 [Planctomycetota bacterium]
MAKAVNHLCDVAMNGIHREIWGATGGETKVRIGMFLNELAYDFVTVENDSRRNAVNDRLNSGSNEILIHVASFNDVPVAFSHRENVTRTLASPRETQGHITPYK